MGETNVNIISGSATLIEDSGRVTIFLYEGTKFVIKNVLLSTKSLRNLFFNGIRRNRYYIETLNKTNVEYLLITNTIFEKKCVLKSSFTLFWLILCND